VTIEELNRIIKSFPTLYDVIEDMEYSDKENFYHACSEEFTKDREEIAVLTGMIEDLKENVDELNLYIENLREIGVLDR